MTSDTAPPATLIWLLYNPARAGRGVELIDRIARSISLGKVVIVWNGEGAVPVEASELRTKAPYVQVLKGSNHGREFGGYQDGLDHLEGSAAGGVFFLNDTAGVHNYQPNFFVDAIASAALGLRGGTGVCVGYTDRALEVLEIDGLTSRFWVRSHLFYLDEVALRLLDWKVYSEKINSLIPGTSPEHFYADGLGQPMRERIDNWLFRPSRRSWYAAAPLSDKNLNFMTSKARAIVQEYYFSMRVSSLGIQISRGDLNKVHVFWMKLINRIGKYTGHLK